MPAPDLISGFYSSSGTCIGISISGFVYLNQTNGQGGLVMSDANGVLWLLQIGTDGRLSSYSITV